MKQWLLHIYFSVRNSWPVWYGLLNRDARTHYAEVRPTLSPIEEKILSELHRDGIAFTTLDAMFPGENLLEKLRTDMEKRGQIEGAQVRKKGFLRPYWDEKDTFDLSNPYFELSLRDRILNIVNSYDCMWRRFNYMHLTETIPVGENAPAASQRWHRDPEEKRMVKMFIYLNDVDDQAGPFTYVKQSQFGSPVYGSLFPQKLPLGIYPAEGAVEKAVRAEDIVSATGKAGSVIFCDTAGLHRGGYAKTKSRFMFTAFYPSTHWTEPTLFKTADSVRAAGLSEQAKFALHLDK